MFSRLQFAWLYGLAFVSLFFTVWFAHAAPGSNEVPQLGAAPDATWLQAQPAIIYADGKGLPTGSGTIEQGAVIYSQQCAGCHGGQGEGASAIELVGDRTLLNTEYPDRGIAVYWPYAPPLFAYVQRSMPPDKPYSLSNDETYAILAQLLYLNDLVKAAQVVDAVFLSTLEMPNLAGFNSLIEHESVR